MKKILLLLLAANYSLVMAAQYKPLDNKSSIRFTIKNFGIGVGGGFSGLTGNISYDAQQPEKTSFHILINSSTINTDNELRDNHLKKEDYFDVAHYPEISFESTKVLKTEKSGMLMVYGKLTIKNHSKEIAFPFSAEAAGDAYLFKGAFSINRKDFWVGGSSIISDNANVTIAVMAAK